MAQNCIHHMLRREPGVQVTSKMSAFGLATCEETSKCIKNEAQIGYLPLDKMLTCPPTWCRLDTNKEVYMSRETLKHCDRIW